MERSEGRRRHVALWVTLAALVLAGAAAGYWFTVREPTAEATGANTGTGSTTQVTRQTLSATESWNGTLGHGAPFPVLASGAGTITRVAGQESEVTRGTELYRLDERPVIALYGTVPMYRDLASGDTGADVKELETNLSELGYDGFDVDDEFTWRTAIAVRAWQDDLGLARTGSVERSDVVFVPASGRVDTVTSAVGSSVTPGTAVLDITGSDQIASVEVDVADRDLVDMGTEVTVGLPGGREVAGTVSSATVTADESDQGGAGGAGGNDDGAGAADSITKVEVTVTEPVDDALLGSPVDVVVDVDERADVLAVPVTALLALAEGGYGLEVVAEDGSRSIVPVQTGLFADGRVEVTGDGIAEGTVVGVAGR